MARLASYLVQSSVRISRSYLATLPAPLSPGRAPGCDSRIEILKKRQIYPCLREFGATHRQADHKGGMGEDAYFVAEPHRPSHLIKGDPFLDPRQHLRVSIRLRS